MKKFIILILFPLFSHGQILELYTGGVEAKDNDLKFSALAGGNIYLDLFQPERQTKNQRVYANRALFGFEHSEMTSKNINYVFETPASPESVASCDCESEAIDNHEASTQTYTFKHRVRAVSLNAGIEVYKGWYLLSGVTSYQHILTLNTEKFSEYRTIYIDAGLQKVITYKRWFFIPKFKFNPETTTFAIGVSYK
jgi:hypothetical protein